ncbi:MAG: hypothetical protein GXO87_01045 [Chlorobi bacterium]|nr:hypothetical protein [Chlorobiota bacterium]
MRKSEPWYIHAALIVVILILSYILLRVAIIDPGEYVKKEKYFKTESRARMDNLRQAEILYNKKFERFCGNLDTLINYVRTDSSVLALMTGVDTLTGRPSNPFKPLVSGEFNFDSLFHSPKSLARYILEVDTSMQVDTVVNRRGKITSIDTTYLIGTKYYIEGPDGYGSIGSLTSDALKNTASWE